MAPAFTASATEACSSTLVSAPTRPVGPPRLPRVRALEEVADGAGLYRVGHGGVLQHARERHDLHVGHRGLYGPRGLYTVHHGHHEVHQDHVWPGLAGKPERLLPVPGLADHPAGAGR